MNELVFHRRGFEVGLLEKLTRKSQEIEMLHEYLLLYSKILKYAPASDSTGKDSNKTQK